MYKIKNAGKIRSQCIDDEGRVITLEPGQEIENRFNVTRKFNDISVEKISSSQNEVEKIQKQNKSKQEVDNHGNA